MTLKAPWPCPNQPCPVNKDNREGWTNIERGKAADYVVPSDLDDLRQKVMYCI